MRLAVTSPMLPALVHRHLSGYIALHKTVKVYFAVQYEARIGRRFNGFASGMT
jgi:hypothetical protein